MVRLRYNASSNRPAPQGQGTPGQGDTIPLPFSFFGEVHERRGRYRSSPGRQGSTESCSGQRRPGRGEGAPGSPPGEGVRRRPPVFFPCNIQVLTFCPLFDTESGCLTPNTGEGAFCMKKGCLPAPGPTPVPLGALLAMGGPIMRHGAIALRFFRRRSEAGVAASQRRFSRRRPPWPEESGEPRGARAQRGPMR
jgi:hypothetical protein